MSIPTQKNNTNFEVRVLTLKRWALPHAKSLEDLSCGDTPPYGDYISFQNYHFIDIEEVYHSCGDAEDALPRDCFFAASYKKLQEKRRQQNLRNKVGTSSCDISIRQSLTLLGKQTAFWAEKPDLLFISMIHLQDIDNFEPQDIEDKIGEVFGELGKETALYFSLDYCDLVLFTKNISLSQLHEKLWSLLFCGKQIARDSSTIFCYRYTYFLSCLYAPDHPSFDHLIISDKLSLAVDLNVLLKDGLQSLRSQLEYICNGQVSICQITGRYDIRILLEITSPESLLAVVRCLDNYCQLHDERGFVSCEIVPTLELSDEPSTDQSSTADKDATHSPTSASNSAGQIAQILDGLYLEFCDYCEKSSAGQPSQLLRIAEVLRSVIALHKNGFSEEFILSILPALKGFMAVCTDYENAHVHSQSAETSLDYQHSITEKFCKLQDDFFSALNMLIQCTMHSERQFIQAPSVNLTLFDIPPKLLIFYTAVAHLVSLRLNDVGDRNFFFLIAPDFRDDIHVRPISQHTADWDSSIRHPNKLLLINLDEESFYKPSVVIELICHEVAHYVGTESRKRKERAESIFKAVAMYVILITLTLPDNNENEAILFAESLGKLLLQKYEEYNRAYSSINTLYFTTDIARFLSEMQAIRVYFVDPSFKELLRKDIVVALSKMKPDFLANMANLMDASMNTTYYSSLLNMNDSQQAAFDSMARKIVMEIEQNIYEIFFDFDKGDSVLLCSYCEDLLQAYSEAYADMRMIEILGLGSAENYKEIAMRYLLHEKTSNLQKCLRYNAILYSGVLGNTYEPMEMPKDYDDTFHQITEYAAHSIGGYLSRCHESCIAADEQLISYWRDINCPNAYKQIKTIYDAALAYKERLIPHSAQDGEELQM